MRHLRAWLARVAGMFRKDARDRELAAEIESHLQLHTDDNMRAGMSPEEARRQAMLRFGPVEAVKESYRDRRGLPAVESLALDVRFGVRMLMKRPAFAAVAVLTLAIGLGANATVASLAYATLFRPPAHVDNPTQLVSVYQSYEGQPLLMSYPEYVDYRDGGDAFEGLVASNDTTVHLRARGAGRRVSASLVTGNFFEVLGVPPAAGRVIRPDDDLAPDGHPIAVISHRLWRTAFASDPGVVGEAVTLNDRGFTIVGVVAAGFHGLGAMSDTDLWVPMMMQGVLLPGRDLLGSRRNGWLTVVGRLRPDVPIEEATERTSVLAAQIEHEAVGGPVQLFDRVWVGHYTRDYLVEVNTALAGVVGLILVLACANVANLQLTQASVRSREMSVRQALGAPRGRLIRQLVVEGLLLAGAGALSGLAIGFAGTRLLALFRLNANMSLADAGLKLDPAVVAVAIALSFVVGLAASLLPAWQGSRPDPGAGLKGGRATGVQGVRLRGALVAAQVAISFVILVAAGLLLQTLLNLQAIDPGFEADRVATIAVDLELDGYDGPRGARLAADAVERLGQIPATEAVAAADSSPFTGIHVSRGIGGAFVSLDGRELPPDHPHAELGRTLVGVVNVTPDYFATLGIPLLAGRPFQDFDDAAAPAVAIVSAAAADSFWPGESPVGNRLRLGRDEGEIVEVVGVAGDIKSGNLTGDAADWIYRPLAQSPTPTLTFLARAEDPETLLPAMRSALLGLDPELTLFRIGTMTDSIGESLWEARLFAGLVATFGILALVLAVAGLYGVLSHAVAQRTREIGLRMTLGARGTDVALLMSRSSIGMLASGAVVGTALALGTARYLESRVYGVDPADPMTFLIIFLVLAGVSALACLVPVRRAMAVEPMVALRDDA